MANIQAKVAAVLDSMLIALNVGSNEGVRRGDKVTLWLSKSLINPDTGAPLGDLRMPRANLRVVHVQDTLSVAEVIDPAQSQGVLLGNVSSEWRRRKQVTSNSREADADTVFVEVGDDATISVRGNEDSK